MGHTFELYQTTFPFTYKVTNKVTYKVTNKVTNNITNNVTSTPLVRNVLSIADLSRFVPTYTDPTNGTFGERRRHP